MKRLRIELRGFSQNVGDENNAVKNEQHVRQGQAQGQMRRGDFICCVFQTVTLH